MNAHIYIDMSRTASVKPELEIIAMISNRNCILKYLYSEILRNNYK